MKNYIYLAVSACVIGLLAISSNAFADTDAVYAQVSSLQNQIPKGSQLVTLEQADDLNGIDQPTPSKLVIKEPGTYIVIAAGQPGVDKNATSAGGVVDLWLMKNGQNVPNSGVRQFLATPQSTSVIISQAILPLKTGDSLSFGYSANKPLHGLIATNGTSNQPAIPSIIVSVYKIGS